MELSITRHFLMPVSVVWGHNHFCPLMWRVTRPISRYYSHLVAVRGRCSISYMHAGTLGFTYMEIHTVKYIFVWIKRWIPILNKSLPHRIQIWSIVKFSYLFWTMSQCYLHFTSHSFTCLSKLPAHRDNDCQGPQRPPGLGATNAILG